ncbi:MAG: pitrilysin family protein [Acidobacteriota bacterium]
MGLKKWAALASVSAGVLPLSLWFSLGVHGSVLVRGNPGPQTSPFVLPIVKRDSLLNGLQLITLEQQSTGSVSAHLRINSGGLFDLAAKGGLADITAGMLLKGGGGLNARNVADTVEQLGLAVTVTTGWDSTDIVTSGPPESLDAIFDLLGKLVITPSFDQKELEMLKAARTATLVKEGQDDSVAVRRKALEAVYGSHPFGRPARGTPESIAQITRPDLVYFHNRFYIANNAELLVRGDATAEQVTRLARSKLGAWKKGERIPPTFKSLDAPPSRRVLLIDRTDEQPARAEIAQIGVSRRAEDYFAAVVMADVLHQQASNITAVHSGTTITSDLEARLLAGPFIVSIKSAPSDLTGDLDVVLDTMTRMQTSVSTNERVESAKAKLIASMAERLKTTAGATEVILDIETYGLGRDYVIRFAERVNSITPADVQRAAQTYLKPRSVTIVIAGSANRFESQMKKLGTVAVLK